MLPQQDQQISKNKRRKIPLLTAAVLLVFVLGAVVAVLFMVYGRNTDKQYRAVQERTSSIIAICADTVTSDDGNIDAVVQKSKQKQQALTQEMSKLDSMSDIFQDTSLKSAFETFTQETDRCGQRLALVIETNEKLTPLIDSFWNEFDKTKADSSRIDVIRSYRQKFETISTMTGEANKSYITQMITDMKKIEKVYAEKAVGWQQALNNRMTTLSGYTDSWTNSWSKEANKLKVRAPEFSKLDSLLFSKILEEEN